MDKFLTFPEYKANYKEVMTLFDENPNKFADDFFNSIFLINEKVLRHMCYMLYINNINLTMLYKLRTNNFVPDFLFNLDKISAEKILTLLKYRFPTVIDGQIFFYYSTPGLWLDKILDICSELTIQIDQTDILHQMLNLNYYPVIQSLLKHGVNPNRKNKEGLTPLSYALLNVKNNLYEIVRDLISYGARLSYGDMEIIKQKNVEKAIESGKLIEPIFYEHNHSYDYDYYEDLMIINEIQQNDIIKYDKTILSWPYYIDETKIVKYKYKIKADEVTAESNPYRLNEIQTFNITPPENLEKVEAFLPLTFKNIMPTENEELPTL